MVKEAEENADKDRRLGELIESRNQLESYLYNLKNSLKEQDDGGEAAAGGGSSSSSNNLRSKLSDSDRETLKKVVEDGLVWLESNQPSSAIFSQEDKHSEEERERGGSNSTATTQQDIFQQKKIEIERIANPILTKAYQSNNYSESGSSSSSGTEDDAN